MDTFSGNKSTPIFTQTPFVNKKSNTNGFVRNSYLYKKK